MQKAARKVLLENRRLHALLAEKGVPIAEVQPYLHGYDYDASFAAALLMPEPADMVGTQSQVAPSTDLQQPAQIYASDAVNRLVSLASPPAMPMDVGLGTASDAGKNRESTGPSNNTELLRPDEKSDKGSERGSRSPNLLGPVLDCYCPDI